MCETVLDLSIITKERRSTNLNHSEELAAEALKVAESGRQTGILVRVLGACAIRIHSPGSKALLDHMQRLISDVDFVSHSKYESEIHALFTSLGYLPDSQISKLYAHMYGQIRDRFKDPKTSTTLDVFYDKLEMCHTIDLRKRLEVDFPTISVSDLLLEKMQIVKINKKDIEDTLVLFREHAVSESEQDSLNSKYIARVLSDDWGFYYTAATNLRNLKEYVTSYVILADSAEVIQGRIDAVLKAIDAHPKSLGWKMRAKIGSRRKWYNEVEEVSMGPGVGGK